MEKTKLYKEDLISKLAWNLRGRGFKRRAKELKNCFCRIWSRLIVFCFFKIKNNQESISARSEELLLNLLYGLDNYLTCWPSWIRTCWVKKPVLNYYLDTLKHIKFQTNDIWSGIKFNSRIWPIDNKIHTWTAWK